MMMIMQGSARTYKGVGDCFSKIIHEEGTSALMKVRAGQKWAANSSLATPVQREAFVPSQSQQNQEL